MKFPVKDLSKKAIKSASCTLKNCHKNDGFLTFSVGIKIQTCSHFLKKSFKAVLHSGYILFYEILFCSVKRFPEIFKNFCKSKITFKKNHRSNSNLDPKL